VSLREATSEVSKPLQALESEPDASHPFSLGQLCLYFLRLGTFGFGGSIALVGYMQRDLVQRRNWNSERDYRGGLALAQLAPERLAAQLA
jgi:chromate transporter